MSALPPKADISWHRGGQPNANHYQGRNAVADVRFQSQVDMRTAKSHVPFTPKKRTFGADVGMSALCQSGHDRPDSSTLATKHKKRIGSARLLYSPADSRRAEAIVQLPGK